MAASQYDYLKKTSITDQAEFLLETLRSEYNSAIDKQAQAAKALDFAKSRYDLQQRVVAQLKEK